MVAFTVTSTPQQSLAYSNRAYVSLADFQNLASLASERGIKVTSQSDMWLNVRIAHFALQVSPNKLMTIDGQIALNGKHRKLAQFTLNQSVEVELFSAKAEIETIEIGIDLLVKKDGAPPTTIDCDVLTKAFQTAYMSQAFVEGQSLAMDFEKVKLDLTVSKLDFINLAALTGDASSSVAAPAPSSIGLFNIVTSIVWKKASTATSPIVLTGASSGPARNDNLFKADFDFEKMGIGGLGSQFQTIFRKAFASRIFPGLMKEMGMNHVRGMLLYGPPGCGKTLIARQIGKVLNAREPKIVNGPEILDKFVGGSEEKVRALFADAEKEQMEMGDNSMLHIIIFDEMDAIMKKRGSTSDSTGVNDSVVNQLLSKIDGVDALNNILIIGMTNRKDMIDEAIMRPGRLEIQIEIGLPNDEGRLSILHIHTAKMKKFNRITQDCLNRLPQIATLAKNYTGAELEGLVRAASSFAFARHVDVKDIKAGDEKAVVVEFDDFIKAIQETVPAFGNKDGAEIQSYCRNGVVNWGPRYSEFENTLNKLIQQAKTSKWAHLMSVLLWGDVSTGKTAIAANLCLQSGYPFVRMISADSMIGMNEAQKCASIYKIFQDSYKSTLSIIFIDDLERIIELSAGPRFSNSVLQTLLILLRKVPPAEDARLLIICTTSVHDSLDALVNDLNDQFTLSLEVPKLETDAEVSTFLMDVGSMTQRDATDVASMCPKPVGAKRLLMALELARDDSDGINKEELVSCLAKLF